jgi:hypothetical protein
MKKKGILGTFPERCSKIVKMLTAKNMEAGG